MEPVRDLDYKLVDVLNALLDTGVVINADVIITVSGIPLIGINLRAALAGMATMLDYGLMEAWDENIRKYYAKELEERESTQIKNEKSMLNSSLSLYGSPTEPIQSSFSNENVILKEKLWYFSPASDIIGETWLPGYMYVTDEKVCWLYHDDKKLFDVAVDNITSITINEENEIFIIPIKGKNKILRLSYKDVNEESTALFSGEEIKIKRVKSTIENANNTLLKFS